MRFGRLARRGAAAAVVVTALVSLPVAAQPTEPAARVDLGAYGGPLRFEAADGAVLEVDGRGRYVDTIEALRAPDGDLVLVNELPTEAYVAGIAEMPPRWPLEALKAQAVASRTYAWFELRQGRWQRRGYDICATTACQVFAGREVVERPLVGERWQQAVDATAGEVLRYEGEPILARYFSTSGGRTRANEEVFVREGPRPYLKAVDDPADAISPLHTWQVRFPRADFDAILARGRQLAAAVPVADVELVPGGGDEGDRVVVTGQDGHRVAVSASAFRGFVSDVAPELFPDRYPGERSDGERLPATLPSSRVSFTVTEDAITVDGRGWGHGVGMSQWGAYGRAEQGATYREILGAYYNGLQPVTAPDLPSRLRVGLDATADGSFTVRSTRPFRVVAGATTITERGLGAWTVQRRPDGSLGLTAPAGYGAPLVVAPTTTARLEPTEVEQVALTTVVNKAVELELQVRDATGALVLQRGLGVREAGSHDADWSLDDGQDRPVAPGRYEVTLVATDEDGAQAGRPVTVEVRALQPPTQPGPSVLGPARVVAAATSPTRFALAALVGLVAGAVAGRGVRRRRRGEVRW